MDFKKKTSCDVGAHFDKFRECSVKIGNDDNPSNTFWKTTDAFR